MTTQTVCYHVSTRPYSPIDALNRRAAATGSPRYAQAAHGADYNGHHIRVWWNDYRGYYIAEYAWAGRNVLCRGSFEDCLRAAMRYYDRGALGAAVSAQPRADDSEAIDLCVRAGLLPGSEDKLPWWTWRHDCACEAARDSACPGRMVMIFDWPLMEASVSREDYEARLREKHGRVYC